MQTPERLRDGLAMGEARLFRPGTILLLALLGAGCASPVKGLFPAPPGQAQRTVYVLHRGWHTGVIVRTADIPPGLWPEHKEYADSEYLEAGWGDIEAYRFPWTTRIVLRALFASKGSVVLTYGFSGPVVEAYADIADEIIAVQLSQTGFARLCAYIQDSYELDPKGQPIPLPSEYAWEDYFLAKGHYSLVNNCNNWTARALRAAGCPTTPRWCLFPGTVMRETRRFGRVIWRQGEPDKAAPENAPALPAAPASP